MSFAIKSKDDILSDMVAWVVSHASQVTDFTPGSVIRSYCEATAMTLEELYVAVYLGFRRQLSTFKSDLFNFEKKAGVTADGAVTFSRTGSSGDVSIPLGTRVKTNSGLQYATTLAGTIANGNTASTPVPVVADKVGTQYNVPAGSIVVLGDDVDGVNTVTNANAVTGGLNEESDYAFTNRFQNYIEGLGRSNIAGLLYGALSVSGVTSASVNELFPPVANVNVRLYVDDGSAAGVSAAKILEVQNIIDGNGTEANPGYRAGGINVQVLAPSIVTQNVVIAITVANSGVDTLQMENEINEAIVGYMNNLGVGADIIRNKIVDVVMEVYGVVDCAISQPTTNVTITEAQVGRAGTISITVN